MTAPHERDIRPLWGPMGTKGDEAVENEFEAGEFVVISKDSSPENLEAAELAAKVLRFMTADADEWRIEAFKRAQADSPGRWPSTGLIRDHFSKIALEAIRRFQNDADISSKETH